MQSVILVNFLHYAQKLPSVGIFANPLDVVELHFLTLAFLSPLTLQMHT